MRFPSGRASVNRGPAGEHAGATHQALRRGACRPHSSRSKDGGQLDRSGPFLTDRDGAKVGGHARAHLTRRKSRPRSTRQIMLRIFVPAEPASPCVSPPARTRAGVALARNDRAETAGGLVDDRRRQSWSGCVVFMTTFTEAEAWSGMPTASPPVLRLVMIRRAVARARQLHQRKRNI